MVKYEHNQNLIQIQCTPQKCFKKLFIWIYEGMFKTNNTKLWNGHFEIKHALCQRLYNDFA